MKISSMSVIFNPKQIVLSNVFAIKICQPSEKGEICQKIHKAVDSS